LGNAVQPFRSTKTLATSDQLKFDQVLLTQGISIPPLQRKRVFKGEVSNSAWNFFQRATGLFYAETVKKNGGFEFISSDAFLKDTPVSETGTDIDGNVSQQGLISAWWGNAQGQARELTYIQFPDSEESDVTETLKRRTNKKNGKGVSSQINILSQRHKGKDTLNKNVNTSLSTGSF
jgi:hypothetical protein